MTERSCVYEHRTGQLLESDLAAGLQRFRELWDDRLAASLNACVHCGLCADSCHYFVATGDPKMQPAYKDGLVQSVFKR